MIIRAATRETPAEGAADVSSFGAIGETAGDWSPRDSAAPIHPDREVGAMSVAPKVLTLLMVVRDGRVLLGHKKRGFGAGFYNGFGGKVEPGESVDEAALRELREEAGIDALDATRRGVVTFVYDDQPRAMRVHIYHASSFAGEPRETDEMRPEWFELDAVPFDRMWPDDEHWYPMFLEGKTFTGTFWFTNTTTIVRHELREVNATQLEAEAAAPSPDR